jgi:hypothetical protein
MRNINAELLQSMSLILRLGALRHDASCNSTLLAASAVLQSRASALRWVHVSDFRKSPRSSSAQPIAVSDHGGVCCATHAARLSRPRACLVAPWPLAGGGLTTPALTLLLVCPHRSRRSARTKSSRGCRPASTPGRASRRWARLACGITRTSAWASRHPRRPSTVRCLTDTAASSLPPCVESSSCPGDGPCTALEARAGRGRPPSGPRVVPRLGRLPVFRPSGSLNGAANISSGLAAVRSRLLLACRGSTGAGQGLPLGLICLAPLRH